MQSGQVRMRVFLWDLCSWMDGRTRRGGNINVAPQGFAGQIRNARDAAARHASCVQSWVVSSAGNHRMDIDQCEVLAVLTNARWICGHGAFRALPARHIALHLRV